MEIIDNSWLRIFKYASVIGSPHKTTIGEDAPLYGFYHDLVYGAAVWRICMVCNLVPRKGIDDQFENIFLVDINNVIVADFGSHPSYEGGLQMMINKIRKIEINNRRIRQCITMKSTA